MAPSNLLVNNIPIRDHRLISASFDGTAKAWPWNKTNFESNRHMEALFVLESELGKVRTCM